MEYSEALRKANEEGLDLVRVTQKISPPVYKILDRGKYLYQQKKKEKLAKAQKIIEIKEIRLRFAISPHDLEIKARQAEKFLKQGNKVRVVMKLRGRENALRDFAKTKVDKFLEILSQDYKVERELKKERGGLSMIISKE